MAIELKPLNKETIQKMGYSNHDLWVVKIADEVFGPFEVETLKHYVSEHDEEFAHAHASRVDNADWQPFYSLAIFSSARKQETKLQAFWLLKDGQKMGPLTLVNIEKKIEMGLLGLSELVSIDEGHTWIKIFQLDAFVDRSFNAEELPSSPAESTFIRGKEDLLEKLNSEIEEKSSAQQGLANLVHLGLKKDNTRLINLDEIDLKSVKETEVSRSLRSLIPVMAGCTAIVLVTCYILFKKPNTATVASQDDLDEEIIPQPIVEPKMPQIPNFRPQQTRRPASVQLFDRSAVTRPASVHDTKYPEPVIETHEAERFPQNEPEPMNEPVAEAEPRDDQEPSIVAPRKPANDQSEPDQTNESLDGSMTDATNNAAGTQPEEQPREPAMEEATDF